MNYNVYDLVPDIHWRWLEKPREMPWYRPLVNSSLSYIVGEPKGTVLDIGSGDGAVDNILCQLGFDVIGIEPEVSGIATARARVPSMKIINSTLENAELPKADYLYSLNTIEHVPNPERYVEAMEGIKRFGLIITDNAAVRKGGKYHEREFTMEELKNLFKGFHIEELSLGMVDFIGIKVWRN